MKHFFSLIIYRMTNHWSFVRIIYVLMGGLMIYQSILSSQYIGILFGIYFFSMGLFAFGCASGNCFSLPSKSENKEINYEELK